MRAIIAAALLAAVGCARTAGGPVAIDDPPPAAPADDARAALKTEVLFVGPSGCMPVTADAKPEAAAPFKLPADVGGKLLGVVLPPTRRPGAMDNPTRPAPPPAAPPRLLALEPGLPAMPPPTPRLPKAAKAPRPHTVTDEAIDEGFDAPAVPAKPSFDPSPRAKEASESVQIAPPLPYLATPPIDRVPLDDPTLEASTAAVLAGAIPERTKALPFVRLSVPEPYEWRVPLLTPLPEEDATPQGPTPAKP